MPNNCHTHIEITTDNASMLCSLIEKLVSTEYKPNSFGRNWLGNIVGNAGISEPEEIFCSGTLEDVHTIFAGTTLSISICSLRDPAILMWVKFIERYCPGADISYEGDDGDGWYYSSDADDKRYHIRYHLDEERAGRPCDTEEDDYDPDEVVSLLQGLLGTNETDFKALTAEAVRSEVFDEFELSQWEYLPLSACR